MMRSATLFTTLVLALFGCKNQPPAEETSMPPDQGYSTVPTQETLQTSADADTQRREQEEADAAAMAKASGPAPLPAADKTFAETAAKAGIAEVEISSAVLDKMKKKGLKDFAQKMI